MGYQLGVNREHRGFVALPDRHLVCRHRLDSFGQCDMDGGLVLSPQDTLRQLCDLIRVAALSLTSSFDPPEGGTTQEVTLKHRNLVAPAVFAIAILILFLWNVQKVGKVQDSYRGVPVYDNGLLFFRSYGKNYSGDGYYYGQKWQCVEFIKRFYYQAKKHKMPDVMGHAKNFFDEQTPDGGLNSSRGLIQFRNGSGHRPQPDDLVVFTDTQFGHVAIVTKVDADSLEVIQQNILGRPRQSFSLVVSNGHYFVTAPRIPAGWLRSQL